MNNKIVLFGAGHYGVHTLRKLRDDYEICFFVDNNPALSGKSIDGVPIIGFEEFLGKDHKDKSIVVCTRAYNTIAVQLMNAGIEDYYLMLDGFLYHTNREEIMMPVELFRYDSYKKQDDRPCILFVQNAACIRTLKIADCMKENGWNVHLLYTLAPPTDENGKQFDVFEKTWGFSTAAALRDFVANSEFDVIHSSNEPDILTCLLITTGKKVVFDTHDMESLRKNVSIETLALEFMANVGADGNIYTSEGVLDIAVQKYNVDRTKAFVLENIALDQLEISEYHQKLSASDNEIHCVYEGGIVGDQPEHHRYFRDIWMRIAEAGVHIHYYSQSDRTYCLNLEKKSPFFHYEGNLGSKQLVSEMTKYDLGLAIFQVNDRNRLFLETGTANKVYEYLNAGLPVVVGDIQSYIQFVKKHNVGIQLDFQSDIRKQLEHAREIPIEKDFLKKNGLTMRSKAADLVRFYEKIIASGQNA